MALNASIMSRISGISFSVAMVKLMCMSEGEDNDNLPQQSVGFGVFFKIIQNRLPTGSLHFNRVFGLRVKGYGNFGLTVGFLKFYGGQSSAKFVGKMFS